MLTQVVRWEVERATQTTDVACVAACVATAARELYGLDPSVVQDELIQELGLTPDVSEGTSFEAAVQAVKRLFPAVKSEVLVGASVSELRELASCGIVILGVDLDVLFNGEFSDAHAVVLQEVETRADRHTDWFADAVFQGVMEELEHLGHVRVTLLDPHPQMESSYEVTIPLLERAYGSVLAAAPCAAMLVREP